MLINKTLPNPLPITIDNNEINKEIVKIFNENTEPISYRDLLKQLFQRKNIKYLSNYYLINHSKRKSIILNDVDFVPLFRYYFDKPIVITNVFKSGTIRDKKFELTPTIKISSVFDFERIIVKTIFNNSLVKIKKTDIPLIISEI